MLNQFIHSNVIAELMDITYTMWSMGWDEKNGGNISYILNEKEINYYDFEENSLEFDLPNVPENLIGSYILITASGSNFRELKNKVLEDAGVIKLTKNGYKHVWGFENNNKPTSEIYMHLLSHSSRLEIDRAHRVVVHNHATDVSTMTFVHTLDEDEFTLSLWRMVTECIVVFPDGVSVIPWMVPGNEKIGKLTAEKLQHNRIVVWAHHGILATGSDFQDAFGLIETVNKAAKLYIDSLKNRMNDGISNAGLIETAEHYNVTPKPGILE